MTQQDQVEALTTQAQALETQGSSMQHLNKKERSALVRHKLAVAFQIFHGLFVRPVIRKQSDAYINELEI